MGGDRESGKINYTNGDGEEREIHIENGHVHRWKSLVIYKFNI